MASDLDWTWGKLEGLAPKKRQPCGCRGSAAPGGRNREAPVPSKRKPLAYNLFVREYFAENFEPDDDASEVFTDATEAWKQRAGRRAGAVSSPSGSTAPWRAATH